MCGITGIYNLTPGSQSDPIADVTRIRDFMASRGPDSYGLWHNQNQSIVLGHRRLTINDLSSAADQPMAYAGQRYIIVFNGEIYNHKQLRHSLEAEGYTFRTHSDTEVILALFAQSGVTRFNELRGMYAFAIWDQHKSCLTLVRDPFGIKPLYYAQTQHRLYFASQVKALKQTPEISARLDPAGVAGFYLWGHVPEPFTLYEAIQSLPAGCYLTADSDGIQEPRHFFDLRSHIAANEKKPALSPEASDQMKQALQDSVNHHMVADVPVALFLSAGLDSSVLTALAQNSQPQELQTHTLGFSEYQGTPYDEAPWAEHIAAKFNTRQHTHRLSQAHAEQAFENALQAMDQPSIDGLNSYYISQMAHQAGAKAALSGLGADELLGGYDHFRWLPGLTGKLGKLKFAKPLFKLSRPLLKPVVKSRGKPEKYASLLEYGTNMARGYLMRRCLHLPWQLKQFLDPQLVEQGLERLQPLSSVKASIQGIHHPKLQLMALEMQWYMRNQLLRDTDWASMAHSLEVRVPFLDIYLLQQVLHLPELLMQSKAQILKNAVPQIPVELIERPKTGFFVPIRDWLYQSAFNQPAPPSMYDWQHAVAQWYDDELIQVYSG